MKTITIALKDMGRAFRSLFALAYMFGVPILMTLLFGFLFGGIGSADAEFSVPKTDVVLVNLDEGHPLIGNFENQGGTYPSMGAMLVDVLNNGTFEDLMNVSISAEGDARAAVDAREAGLAIIIPTGFTNALVGQSDERAEIEFYQDPELSLGPEICQSIVMSIVDDFSMSKLSMETVLSTLAERGITLSQDEQLALNQTLTQAAEQTQQQTGASLKIVPPMELGAEAEPESLIQTIIRSIMGGMMVMYAFYTGTSAAVNILEEEENGTLARLFISPTEVRTILNGKFLSGFLMVVVQVVVLMIFGNLAFGINWGPIPLLALFAVGLVALAASFGIFIMSLVKGTRQAGIIYGAVLTFTGMLGISSVFTMGTSAEAVFKFVPLIVPQGWAMRTIESAWSGDVANTLFFAGGMLVLAVVFFAIGNARFKKRFA